MAVQQEDDLTGMIRGNRASTDSCSGRGDQTSTQSHKSIPESTRTKTNPIRGMPIRNPKVKKKKEKRGEKCNSKYYGVVVLQAGQKEKQIELVILHTSDHKI